tara:strand:+ start:141 stop:1841 length:1701 start_codon:yes stop_codon:yes gene_type:complete
MKIVELILEDGENVGVDAISIVENPAIEEDFVALKSQEVKFAEADKEKKILVGALLTPNKPIYRRSGEEEYYIYFSRETVRKASQLFLKDGNQSNSTLEHNQQIEGLTLVESWIVEDKNKDKSAMYNMDVPLGTWMGAVKVDNDEIWDNYVKTGKVKGFSIEGFFADKIDRPKDQGLKEELARIEEEEAQFILQQVDAIVLEKEIEMESFSDYPQSVRNNAKRGMELNEKQGNKCATQVGKIRAADLAAGRPVSESTVKRMYSFLSRAETYYDQGDPTTCGYISYLLWGGKTAKNWAENKIKSFEGISEEVDLKAPCWDGYEMVGWKMKGGKKVPNCVKMQKFESMVIDENFAIIDDRLAYSTQEKAEEMAINIGCKGFHTHEFEGKTWYMPCKTHIKDEMKIQKCPKGFVKNKAGKCVRRKSTYAEIGPRGGIRKSPKAPGSSTPNKNPKGKGTAKGDASTGRGAKVSKKDEESLQKKSDDFNKRYKDKLGYGVTVGKLKAVFQRGLGAFNVSHSPRVSSASQWAHARVNAFMYLVRNGRPENPKYTGDFDLLPTKHPKSPQNKK